MLEIIYKQAEGNFLASVEVYFKEKPSKEVTTFLKQNNFRFTYKEGKHWWAYTNQFTNQILAELELLVTTTLKQQVEEPEADYIEPIKIEEEINQPKIEAKQKAESYPALAPYPELEIKRYNNIKYKPVVDLNEGNKQVRIIYCHTTNYTIGLIRDIIKLSFEYVMEWVKEWNKWRKAKTNFKRVKDLNKLEWKGFTEIALINAFGLISITKTNLKEFTKAYPKHRILKLEKVGTLMLMELDKKINPNFA